jgi:hypothetical protein
MANRRKQLIDVRHPFFRPVWRRVLITAFLVGWTVFEVGWGSMFWAMLFGALGVFCFYEFFVAYDPANYEDRDG